MRGGGDGGDRDGGGGAGADHGAKVRKASYYVWFLGAEECRGLRGGEYVRPVVQYLIGREQTQEPDKVTLQVSARGIKLLQVFGSGTGSSPHHPRSGPGAGMGPGAGGPTKHFIPAGAVTYVEQEQRPNDDIVSAIVLIYNPVTRCPVHVHSYRCDSVETASLLRENLSQLVHRPEQQAKLLALEARLSARGILPPGPGPQSSSSASGYRGPSDGSSSGGSSGASSSSNSAGGGGHGGLRNGGISANKSNGSAGGHGSSGHHSSSNGGAPGPGGGMANLYDSLAAELREKLGSRGGPLLLPPRDYDQTLQRESGVSGGGRGQLGPGHHHHGHDRGGSRYQAGPGGGGGGIGPPPGQQPRKTKESADSVGRGGSSGIGSDDAPSPVHDSGLGLHRLDHHRLDHLPQPTYENQSSSDEEWEAHGSGEVRGQEGMILVQSAASSWQKQQKQQQQQHQSHYQHRSSSPSRGRIRATHASPVHGRHNSPARIPRDSREQVTRESLPHMSREMSRDLSREITRELNRDQARDKPRDKHRDKPREKDVSPIRPVHQKVTPPRRNQPRDRSESPVSPCERFHDARDKFRSLERDIPWLDASSPGQQNGLNRTPSWEQSPKYKDSRGLSDHLQGSREALWPKSDRDTGYGSRDGLLRERRPRDYDRGYGTCDTRDSDPWRSREIGQRTPELWQMDVQPGKNGYHQGPSPIREYKNHRTRTPDRQDYHRAKSMHDLSQRKVVSDHDPRNDPRRRSMYDTAEDQLPLRDSHSGRRYRSQASLRRRNSCSSESCASESSFRELPDTQRYPGLDRASARPNPLNHEKLQSPGHISNRRTFDYPLNGGAPAVHINRTYQDDYRRLRYEPTPQFIRSTSVPTNH